jgi:hypothetical protein
MPMKTTQEKFVHELADLYDALLTCRLRGQRFPRLPWYSLSKRHPFRRSDRRDFWRQHRTDTQDLWKQRASGSPRTSSRSGRDPRLLPETKAWAEISQSQPPNSWSAPFN